MSTLIFYAMNETKSQARGESPRTGPTLRSVAPYVILLVVAFSVYLNALKNDFVWDDDILIVENHLIRSWSHLPKLLSQSLFQLEAEGILGGRYYRPLVSLSYVIDYSLWGLNPAGYHLTNILFHCLNVLLLFHLFVRILGDRTTGFIASLLFAANPVNSHVVTFIATRSDLFAFLFFILSLLMYHMYRRPIGDAKPRFYIGALVFFCLSLLCKEIALTLPPIVFLHDLCLTDRFRKDGFAWKSFVIYVPFAAILVGYFSLRQLAISGGLEFAIYSLSDLIYRISTIIVSIPLYWEQLLFPTGLSYDRTVDVVSSLTSPSFLGSLAIVSAFLILTVYWWRKDKRLFFCSAWFFIVFAPASNLLPIFPSLAATTLYIPIHFLHRALFHCGLGDCVRHTRCPGRRGGTMETPAVSAARAADYL